MLASGVWDEFGICGGCGTRVCIYWDVFVVQVAASPTRAAGDLSGFSWNDRKRQRCHGMYEVSTHNLRLAK